MAVIPQDPFLFDSSIRDNIDPFSTVTISLFYLDSLQRVISLLASVFPEANIIGLGSLTLLILLLY